MEIRDEIADNCKIKTSGVIEWKQLNQHMYIYADALADTPLYVSIGFDEYNLDITEESIKEFEAATGIKAAQILDTVSIIRNEYREALNRISEIEYQKLCAKMETVIVRIFIMWGIYILVWAVIRIKEKVYQKKIDKSMKDYI